MGQQEWKGDQPSLNVSITISRAEFLNFLKRVFWAHLIRSTDEQVCVYPNVRIYSTEILLPEIHQENPIYLDNLTK